VWLFTIIVAGVVLAYFYWAFGATFWQSAAWALILFLLVLAFFRKPLNEATSLANFWTRATEKLQIALISDTRNLQFQPKQGTQGYAGSLFMGVVFSAGWTPCIGPVYGAVLTLANDAARKGDSLWPAATLLTAYSLGLGIPFLLTALALNQATGVMRSLKRNMLTIERVSGALLLVIGVLILTGGLTNLSQQIAGDGELGDLSIRLEACTAGVAEGRLAFGRYGTCVSEGYEKISDSERFIRAVSKGNDTVTAQYIFPLPENYDDIPVGLEIGNRAPDFTLQTLDGRTVSLADLRGKAVILNFWATWCGPCRNEMPNIEQVYQLEKERGLVVLAVDFLEPADSVQAFVDELNLTLPIGLDLDGTVNDLYRIPAYPTSYFIDGNGIIIKYKEGEIDAQWIFDGLEQFQTTENEPETVMNLN
jgi:cytochrome c biogenesis protein CcdA/peroxiredoxin